MITCKLPNTRILHVGMRKWNPYHWLKKSFHHWTDYKHAMTSLDVEIELYSRARGAYYANKMISHTPYKQGPKRYYLEIC